MNTAAMTIVSRLEYIVQNDRPRHDDRRLEQIAVAVASYLLVTARAVRVVVFGPSLSGAYLSLCGASDGRARHGEAQNSRRRRHTKPLKLNFFHIHRVLLH
jgi:hypothetical protein